MLEDKHALVWVFVRYVAMLGVPSHAPGSAMAREARFSSVWQKCEAVQRHKDAISRAEGLRLDVRYAVAETEKRIDAVPIASLTGISPLTASIDAILFLGRSIAAGEGSACLSSVW
jgi:hypothetical protein